ncbi:retron St85 family RNA-directed DNA polymerase [Enterococcus italicus]|uniref:retron St85 family RNA-directed DNA polymerase n=1 Tax=Enterococcus italicus TaxID=246144 RepID=UPI0020745DCE|nr:retron St85 family RNA-directed DNA polymerase [Enterococcus italicus]MCM6881690.1 retron St85 family RNA-directed DNA polymerase [Enterococcus italicus]
MDLVNSRPFLLGVNGLPVMTNINDISRQIGISSRRIYEYTNYTSSFYHMFEIPKKDKSIRIIHAPFSGLKMIQRWILETILYKIRVDTPSYGFLKGKKSPTKQNAEIHSSNIYLFQTDIKNFFTNVDFKRVYSIFLKIGYNKEVSLTLARLCCLDGYLPQGGVTSPYLSHLVCFRMDRRIMGLCQKREIVYSRYADDIVLSSDNKNDLKKARVYLENIIHDEGFELNPKKTRYSFQKKLVTGLTIHDNKVLVPRAIKRELRSKIYNAIVFNDYSSYEVILGYVSYINSIENGYIKKVRDYIKGIINNESIGSDNLLFIKLNYEKSPLYSWMESSYTE